MYTPQNPSTPVRESIPRAPLEGEKDLLRRIAGGEEAAFRTIYDHYRQRIYNLGMYLTRSEILAEEMVQDVFLKTWEYRTQLKKIDHFNAWLRTVAKNTASNYLRNLATERVALTRISTKNSTSNLVTEDTVVGREYDQILQEAIEQLPTQQQKVYKLSRFEGMKQDDIARAMGISVYTVKEYMKLALRSIRKSLEEKIDVAIILAIALFLD